VKVRTLGKSPSIVWLVMLLELWLLFLCYLLLTVIVLSSV